MTTLTAKLNNGVIVLAKKTPYGSYPLTYTNRTQAERKAQETGGTIYGPPLTRPFYVRPSPFVEAIAKKMETAQ